jgi:multiple sugar transport system ATP-binding protein
MNLIPATVNGEGAVIGGQSIDLTPAQRSALTGSNVVVGIRPEGWILKPAGEGIAATVEVVEELGSDQFLYCSTSAPQLTTDDDAGDDTTAPPPITVRAPGMSAFQRGEKVGLVPQTGAVHLFDAETGDRLPD